MKEITEKNKSFSERGVVEGYLEQLNTYSKTEFIIYELLHSEKIICTAKNNNIFKEACNHFQKKVELEGIVTYKSSGIPCQIKVDKITPIATPPKGSWKDIVGILN